jgi:hypothetical protein
MIRTLFEAVVKWWKQLWFESKLKARLKMIELENQIESELEREEMNRPIYREHKIDPELQTGESQKLGGAIQLTSPWYQGVSWDVEDDKEKERKALWDVAMSCSTETGEPVLDIYNKLLQKSSGDKG